MLRSPNRMSPVSGASWPLIMLKQVDLPAPFGPISARNSPSPTSKLTSSTARTPPKDFAQRTRPTSTLMAAPSCRGRRSTCATAPTMPPGNASTSSRMMPPSSARQNSVCRMTVSCSTAKTDAPTIGPVSVWMPPSSTITRPSMERPTAMVSGEIEPLAKANSAAGDAADRARDREAEPVHALDVDADRFGAQRRIAAGAHRVAERREQHAPQQQHAADRRARASAGNKPRAVSNGAVGQMPRTPLEPPVRSSHWNTIAQTICAKASVSIAR